MQIVSYNSALSARPGEGFEVWHELCRPMLMTEALGQLASYHAHYAFSEVGGMIFTRTRYSATRFTRTAARADAGDGDGAVLHLYWNGREQINLYDRIYEMAPDRIVLHDWGHPYVGEATDADQLSVHIPPHLLHDRQGIHGKMPVITWLLDSLEGQLLAETLTRIWYTILEHGADQAKQAASGFIGLLNGLIDAKLRDLKAPSESLETSPLMMRSYLLRQLGDPELSIDTLCRTFQCSRATIYRYFSEAGGVNAFIREQRLEACMRDLQNAGESRRTTREIANRWGFKDMSYFHRLFKQKYQLTPGDASRIVVRNTFVKRVSGLADEHARNIQAVHDWFGVHTPI